MAKFFIDRPVFAIVIAVLIVIAGTISGFSLPIGLYPDIEPPTVSVTTTYLGASATVVNEGVSQVIEEQVNGVQGMDYMNSYASDTGSYTLNVVFEQGTDGDIASVKVQNNVSQANASLPTDVLNVGVVTQKASPNMSMVVSLHSPKGTYDNVFLYNYMTVYILDEIKRINGVGQVQLFGSEFARRVWLNPDRMAALNLTVSDVIAAIQEQNVQAPAGTIGALPAPAGQEFQYTGTVKGRLASIGDFENIIVKAHGNGSFIFLRDIARVENGARYDSFIARFDGHQALGIGINLTSDANMMKAIAEIRQVFERAAANFPPDLEYSVILDTTENISASLEEVVKTFFEAMLLVLLIVFVFLQSIRATLIPMLAVPVSLIGTFGAFVFLGFSINTLTLFAMVLAIGLVVDDAIVVIEAVEHHIKTNCMSPREATRKAMDEVSGPVVAIAFVLASVFIPVAFLGGMTGVLYRQFALTIAVSMGLSAFIALSLTPALCAMLLKPHDPDERKGFFARFFDKFNDGFDRMTNSYSETVKKLVTHAKYVCIFLVILVIGIVLLARVVPSTFVPDEDQGIFIASVTLPEGTSLNRTMDVIERVGKEILTQEGVTNLMTVAGYDVLSSSNKSNAGTIFTRLAPWEERKTAATQINAEIGQVFRHAAKFPEASVIAFNMPALPGLGMLGGFTMVLQDLNGRSNEELAAISQKFVADANKMPEVSAVYTTYKNNFPGYHFEIDREKVKTNGVLLSDVFTALQVNFGGMEVNDFNLFGRTYKVSLQADVKYRNEADMTRFIFVRSSNGSMIPLDALVNPTLTSAPTIISRFNAARSIEINGGVGSGYSSGQALAAMEDLAKRTLPQGFNVEWSGQSREEKKAGGQTNQIMALALIFVFLCLAALYESWGVPFAVLFSVPTGIFGAFFSQYVVGLQNSIYMQIGIITLIGLAAKNAILIVEFAKVRTDEGMEPKQAAVEAAKLRLRPILMTSLAFIIGCLPLAIATGAGAQARNAMGTAVVGGMAFATSVGIFIIPSLFVVVEWFVLKFGKHEEKSEGKDDTPAQPA